MLGLGTVYAIGAVVGFSHVRSCSDAVRAYRGQR
jgi:hypothetical protein